MSSSIIELFPPPPPPPAVAAPILPPPFRQPPPPSPPRFAPPDTVVNELHDIYLCNTVESWNTLGDGDSTAGFIDIDIDSIPCFRRRFLTTKYLQNFKNWKGRPWELPHQLQELNFILLIEF